MRLRTTIFTALLWFGTGAATLSAQDVSLAPEAATGTSAKLEAVGARHMVAAADPLAAEAGRAILRRGGSAVDAAIAVQLVLGLVEPQSSGLGGGAFLLHWDAVKREVTAIDARETAPAAAKPDRFLRNGTPMAFGDAIRSGLSTGVPGVLRGLELAHRRFGKLPWADLFGPAIKLAEGGFTVSPRLSMLLAVQGPEHFSKPARAYFFDDGSRAWPAGYVLKNPQYAATLRRLAADGPAAFYSGAIADDIVKALAEAPIAPSDMTLADLAAYQAKERPPLCIGYRARRICSMGPPSSGGLTIAQTLKLIEPFAGVQGADNAMTPRALHLIAEAEKLSYADRNRYIADPDFVAVPSGLLDANYLATRRALIDPQRAAPKAEPGLPPGAANRAYGADAARELVGTSHLSIVDDAGNAVAMTTTIESAFGSGVWASGFLLNNELTDFSLAPTDSAGAPMANAVAGGKRPRSSMAPTFAFDKDGNLELITGSPGGSRIILFVVKTLVSILDWNMGPAAAAVLANFGSEGGPFQIEPGFWTVWPALGLKTYGHTIRADEMTSGMHTIIRRNGRLIGAADPRREGAALGD